MSQPTRPSSDTRAEEAREATEPHDAGREPTADEESAAEQNTTDPGTREAYEEAVKRGAKQEGEGRPGR